MVVPRNFSLREQDDFTHIDDTNTPNMSKRNSDRKIGAMNTRSVAAGDIKKVKKVKEEFTPIPESSEMELQSQSSGSTGGS